MNLLLARHGNTFGPGDTPVWVGADQDLPLVETGKAQAETLGKALAEAKLVPTRIVAGPLKRTVEYGEIISTLIEGPSVEIDPRLREIDYGSWGGKTTEDIIAKHGESSVQAWNARGQWPERGDWQPDLSDLRRDLKLLVNDISGSMGPDETVLIISSNGILRFFLDMVPGAFALRARDETLKTATGAISAIGQDGGAWIERFWNQKPTADLLKGLMPAEADQPVA
ncbi:MAG: histidine phosphatase family protein [Alphaproteobacteria bacterium]|nr:histidine phosphatase family protein [Alphaproteobacteria bacterium SS10]